MELLDVRVSLSVVCCLPLVFAVCYWLLLLSVVCCNSLFVDWCCLLCVDCRCFGTCLLIAVA